MSEELTMIVTALLSSGVVWATVDGLKKVHPFFDTFAPLVAMVIGVLLGLLFVTGLGGMSVLQGVLAGMSLAGLTSSTYAQTKKFL